MAPPDPLPVPEGGRCVVRGFVRQDSRSANLPARGVGTVRSRLRPSGDRRFETVSWGRLRVRMAHARVEGTSPPFSSSRPPQGDPRFALHFHPPRRAEERLHPPLLEPGGLHGPRAQEAGADPSRLPGHAGVPSVRTPKRVPGRGRRSTPARRLGIAPTTSSTHGAHGAGNLGVTPGSRPPHLEGSPRPSGLKDGGSVSRRVPRYRLRPARLKDLGVLLAHRRGMWEGMAVLKPGAPDATEERCRRWIRQRLKNGRVVGFVIEAAPRTIVASGCLWIQDIHPRPGFPGPRYPYLMSMYTEPAHRGRGLATRIVRAALRWSRGRGYHRITLHASDAGRPLYQRLGFYDGKEMRLDL